MSGVLRIVGIDGFGAGIIDTLVLNGARKKDCVLLTPDSTTARESEAGKIVQVGEEELSELGALDGREEPGERVSGLKQRVEKAFDEAELLVIVGALGEKASTKLSLLAASAASEIAATSVALVSTPFDFEDAGRHDEAEVALRRLGELVNSTVVMANGDITWRSCMNVRMTDMLNASSDILANVVKGICDITNSHGLINSDFSKVRTVLSQRGFSAVGIGKAEGENSLESALYQAVTHPMLDLCDLSSAQGLIVHVAAGPDFNIGQLESIDNLVGKIVGGNATVILGLRLDHRPANSVTALLLGTGMATAKQSRLCSRFSCTLRFGMAF
ncbi:hypothetical protein DYI41_04850 [Marinobacter salarius]|uniref:hypothetical protein n=1 Tax=Marinobacter salarius TaxID=1420917 RepID=UPI001BCF0266|nr:hypothetical protein [Marinobacter salarius]MBS8230258.1 hypothetical protein [Marinobacter salarius]